MSSHTIETTTWKSIQLVNAIKQMDEERVVALLGSEGDTSKLSSVVRTNSSYVVEHVANGHMSKHARLWAAPVVIKHSDVSRYSADDKPIDLKSDLLTQVIKRSFSFREEIHYWAGLLPLEALTSLTPTQTYSACKALAGMPPGASINFTFECSRTESEIPQLAFILGTASCINFMPELKPNTAQHSEKIRRMLAGLIGLKVAPESRRIPNPVTALQPMEFAQAIVRGVDMWLDAMALDYSFHAVNLSLRGQGKYVFDLFVQHGEDADVERVSWAMKSTQVDEDAIAQIYHRLEAICSYSEETKAARIRLMH